MAPAEEWHEDISITPEIVKNCLESQFPTLLPITEITQIGEGWDNKVFLINQKIIFRFPRRKVAVALLEQENNLLNHLPIFDSIQIPRPRYIGYPIKNYPYAFQGYEMIKGKSAYQIRLNIQERLASLPILAQFLKQLHQIDERQARLIGAKVHLFDRNFIQKTRHHFIQRATKIMQQKICPLNENMLKKEIGRAKNLLPSSIPKKCLVHGDLDARHAIFDQQRLTGIIDWGDMGIDDIAIDLAFVWIFYPISSHRLFFDAYGEVDANTWENARFLALYSAFTLILYGHDIHDARLVSDAISAIKRMNPAFI